jgi:alkylation response protein AidB-like acyl-CoA dehydrogenase
MDFHVTYSESQQHFRAEVARWLAEVVPDALLSSNEHFESRDAYELRRDLGRSLGRRGWLYPMAPTEYGGGGLDLDSALVLAEELRRLGLGLPPYYDSGGVLGSASILHWGNDEQKAELLPPIYSGEQRTWQLLTEPSAGSDVAAVATTAVRRGDDYVITGQKSFIGSLHGADAHWALVRTGPAEDRHHNLSWFMIDGRSPGITITPQHLLGGIDKNTIYLDEVRVPANRLVGGENQGWQVAFTHLDHEHGLRSDRFLGQELHRAWERIVTAVGDPASGVSTDDPVVLDLLAKIYVKKETVRLLGKRNYWLAMENRPRTYEGPQGYYLEKKTTQWLATALLELFGAAATADVFAAGVGAALVEQQALGAMAMHGGGTGEIQKLIMSRALRLGKPTSSGPAEAQE